MKGAGSGFVVGILGVEEWVGAGRVRVHRLHGWVGTGGGKGASASGVIGGRCSVPVRGLDPGGKRSLRVLVREGGCG